jgi:hypothetical protein
VGSFSSEEKTVHIGRVVNREDRGRDMTGDMRAKNTDFINVLGVVQATQFS